MPIVDSLRNPPAPLAVGVLEQGLFGISTLLIYAQFSFDAHWTYFINWCYWCMHDAGHLGTLLVQTPSFPPNCLAYCCARNGKSTNVCAKVSFDASFAYVVSWCSCCMHDAWRLGTLNFVSCSPSCLFCANDEEHNNICLVAISHLI